MNNVAGTPDRTLLVAGLASGISLLVYLLSLSQSLNWHDSAELALVAVQLGASHSPGSPLHAALGHILALFFDEPFMAVNLLSAITASAAVGALAALVLGVTRSAVAAVAAALIYAFSFQVWAAAVVTELYSLSSMLLAFSLLYLWRWTDSQRSVDLWLGILAYGLSLTAYFANIMLLPAYLFLVGRVSRRPTRELTAFLLVVATAVCLTGLANWVMARIAPPSGEVFPDSLTNLVIYMSGSQHGQFAIRDLDFLASRLLEHAETFSRSILFIGVLLAIPGAIGVIRRAQNFGIFLILVFLIYQGYYTFFGPGDYYLMVLPAYMVAAIWIGACRQEIAAHFPDNRIGVAMLALPVLLAAGLLLLQFEGRRQMATARQAEQFAATTFAQLPPSSVAITGWKEFTVLRYFQEIHGQRTDLRLAVPAMSVRRYPYGVISDYVSLVDQSICAHPVFTTKNLAELGERFSLEEPNGENLWGQVQLRAELFEDSCG